MQVIVKLSEKEKKIIAIMLPILESMGWGIDNKTEASRQIIETACNNDYDEDDDEAFTSASDDQSFYESWSDALDAKYDWNNGGDGWMDLMAAHRVAVRKVS